MTGPVRLVAHREIRARVRTRGFVIGILATLVIMAGYALLVTAIGPNNSSTVAVSGPASSIAEPLRTASAQQGSPVATRAVATPEDGLRLLRDGEVDALVTGAPETLHLVVEQQADPPLRTALDNLMHQRALDAELLAAGRDPAQVRSTVDGSHVTVSSLNPSDPERGQRLMLALAAGVLLYMFLMTSASTIAQGVVEEKSSRVVELLLSAIRPAQLLAGKVLGVGAAGLLQFTIIGGVALAGAVASGALALPSGALLGTLLWSLVWFMLGFLFYGAILAATASLVSRTEELQHVTGPVLMLPVVPFVVGLTTLPDDPDSALGSVLSLVPGMSPVLMPMRIALGVAAVWEVALSVVLMLAAIVGLFLLGGRVYSNAVLRTGARVRLREALRKQ